MRLGKHLAKAGLALGLALFSGPAGAGPLAEFRTEVFCPGQEVVPAINNDLADNGPGPYVYRRDVPAAPGVVFGFSARAAEGDITGATLAVTQPVAGGDSRTDSRPIEFYETSPTAEYIFLLTQEDLVPGSWRMLGTLGDEVLFDLSFDLVASGTITTCN